MAGILNKILNCMAKLYNDCSNDALSFDMDYFAPLTSKKEWIPTAYEVYELIKNNRKPEIKFSICFTLETTSFPCECPETITDSLFRNVATPPSLIIFKQDNFSQVVWRFSQRQGFNGHLSFAFIGITDGGINFLSSVGPKIATVFVPTALSHMQEDE